MKRLKCRRLQPTKASSLVVEEVTNCHEVVPPSLARILLSTHMTLSDILSSCNGDNRVALLTSACNNMFIKWSSSSFSKTFQWSTEELTGYDMQFLYGVDTSKSNVKAMLRDVRTSRHGSARLVLYCKDGMNVCTDVTVTPVYDFSDNVMLLTNYLFIMTIIADSSDENYDIMVQRTKNMCRNNFYDDEGVAAARPVTPDQLIVDNNYESDASIVYNPNGTCNSNTSPTDRSDDDSSSYNQDSDDTDSSGENSDEDAILSQYYIDRRIVCKSDVSNFVELNEGDFQPLMSVCNLSQVLEMMSHAVGTPLILLDCIGRITFANTAYCAMYGYTNTDIQQRFYANVFFGQVSDVGVAEEFVSFIEFKRNILYQSFSVVSHHKNNLCLSVNINAVIIFNNKNQKHHVVCKVESPKLF